MRKPFTLPVKKKAQFPIRRTFCISNEMELILQNLESKDVDIPELFRLAVEQYLDQNRVSEFLSESKIEVVNG